MREPVVSSHIEAIEYDEDSSILIVHFSKGGAYGYFGVPLKVVDSFRMSVSKSEFFREAIKGSYETVRM